MLGSPIRTPPDHSSVANSPGLIAGSYVLHRLLMPRHPPCALHSLSHKHSTKTTKTLNTTGITRWRQKVTGSHPTSRCSPATDARVHYPIHKQPAHQPPNPTTVRPRRKRHRDNQPQPITGCYSLIPQGPTVCQHLPHPTTPRFHSSKLEVLKGPRTQTRPFIDDSTSEHHHRHCTFGSDQCACSLERR